MWIEEVGAMYLDPFVIDIQLPNLSLHKYTIGIQASYRSSCY